MSVPSLKKFIEIEVDLGDPVQIGQGRGAYRKIIPIIGGRVRGEIIGEVLSIGADWQSVYSPKLAYLDTRYSFQTHDGYVIEIINRGFRHTTAEISEKLLKGEEVDPKEYYFRTSATLETGENPYSFVNNRIFVGSGKREKNAVILDLYMVN